jgi:hypothetical protein
MYKCGDYSWFFEEIGCAVLLRPGALRFGGFFNLIAKFSTKSAQLPPTG